MIQLLIVIDPNMNLISCDALTPDFGASKLIFGLLYS